MKTAVFAAISVNILGSVLTYPITKITYKVYIAMNLVRDRKMKILNECFTNIKFVKITGYEKVF